MIFITDFYRVRAEILLFIVETLLFLLERGSYAQRTRHALQLDKNTNCGFRGLVC